MIADVAIEEPRWQQAGLADLAEVAALATFEALGLEAAEYEISLLGCDDARISALNGDFREKPQPTNVLSWPAVDLSADQDGAPPAPPEAGIFGPQGGGSIELGDIAIAYETCAREAAAQGKTLNQHSTHLIVHGVLHLLGYDHIRDKDATLMEAHERGILGKMGLPDPYIENDTDI